MQGPIYPSSADQSTASTRFRVPVMPANAALDRVSGCQYDVPVSDAIRTSKAQLRTECKHHREELGDDLVARHSARIRERILQLDEWGDAEVVHTYVDSKSNEVETRQLIQVAFDRGRRVFVPLVTSTGRPPLHHAEIRSLDDLVAGPFGLLQPAAAVASSEPIPVDLVIVPGLAFDARGGRLGWGRGFYDDFLSGVDALKIGVAYAQQIVESVPINEHDIYMDKVITEETTYHIS